MEDFERAKDIDSTYMPEAYMGLGAAYLELQDYEAALAALDIAVHEVSKRRFEKVSR
jgi:tetratricopeptide (TPR) repeat protein